jgi:hypothetical protein
METRLRDSGAKQALVVGGRRMSQSDRPHVAHPGEAVAFDGTTAADLVVEEVNQSTFLHQGMDKRNHSLEVKNFHDNHKHRHVHVNHQLHQQTPIVHQPRK